MADNYRTLSGSLKSIKYRTLDKTSVNKNYLKVTSWSVLYIRKEGNKCSTDLKKPSVKNKNGFEK